MKKETDTLLGLILLVLSVFLVVAYTKNLSPQIISPDSIPISFPEQKLGFSGYNELRLTGMTYATTEIGLLGGVPGDKTTTTASTTGYKIFDAQSGRMWAEISLTANEVGEVWIYLGTTTATSMTPTVLPDIPNVGTSMGSSTLKRYVIDPDNLWKGEVWGFAKNASVTIRTIENY